MSEISPPEVVTEKGGGTPLFTIGEEQHPHTGKIITVARACHNEVHLKATLDDTGLCVFTFYERVKDHQLGVDVIDETFFRGNEEDLRESAYICASKLKNGVGPSEVVRELDSLILKKQTESDSEANKTVKILDDYVYISKPNKWGVEGYNLVANPALAHRFPMPKSQLQPFFESFCARREIDPSKIPFTVELTKHDDVDIRPLAIAAVIMVFEEFGYSLNDTEGFSVISPRGPLVTTLESGVQRMLVEHYDEDTHTVYVANRLFYDSDIRRQFADRYNIPVDASADYLMTYLIAHSSVHHMQKLQNRMKKNPEGYKYDPEMVLKDALDLQTEKEAHNVGIKIADEIWMQTVGRKKKST